MTDRLKQRAWLTEHWHAAGWLVVALLLFATYVVAHQLLRDCYLEDIRPQVEDAVRSYGLVSNPRTGVLELYAGDAPYDRKSDARGPLGIGSLPAARGVLNDAVTVIENYNAGVRRYVEALQDEFFRSPHNQHYMAMVAPQQASTQTQLRFRVPAASFLRTLQEYPNEKSLDVLIDMIARAEPTRVKIDDGTEDPDDEGKASVKELVCEMCRRRKELRADVTLLFGPSISSAAACQPDGRQGDGEFPTALDDQSESVAHGEDSPDNCLDRTSAQQCDGAEETAFHADLRGVVEGNTGYFWVAGTFFWYEIMALAVLGVLSRQLVLFARAYRSGGRSKRVWRPSESLRTVMYLFVAPIFSLVIIWILSATHIVVVKPVIGEVWSNATVPIAFLLGLFPTLGYDVLRGLAKGLFNRPFVDQRAKARPQEIPAMPDDDAGARPSFAELRRRIRHHATAVFR